MAKQSLKYRDEDRSLDLYLREIGETPLINAAEEVRLAKVLVTLRKDLEFGLNLRSFRLQDTRQ